MKFGTGRTIVIYNFARGLENHRFWFCFQTVAPRPLPGLEALRVLQPLSTVETTFPQLRQGLQVCLRKIPTGCEQTAVVNLQILQQVVTCCVDCWIHIPMKQSSVNLSFPVV